ncbi:unnamed protein product [Penicillium palitans]
MVDYSLSSWLLKCFIGAAHCSLPEEKYRGIFKLLEDDRNQNAPLFMLKSQIRANYRQPDNKPSDIRP